ncbi:response regulator [Spirosoma taeanense]|uniref:Response regulator n=1 Tax=Spirosoma taeanense TaxID=2735870 RepID=A0A6M5Y8T9_9BACT|nr:response regulator [Spirosoma taeanense]QJW89651.1 response regulator [Spirosoma taeanense]
MFDIPNPLIYAVDDDPDDCVLLQQVFSSRHSDCQLRCLDDGSQLLIWLTHRLDGRLPDLILLDLHMPVLNGFDVLRLLKQDDVFSRIPIVVISSSDHDNDLKRCEELGGVAFITKSGSYRQLAKLLDDLRYQLLD